MTSSNSLGNTQITLEFDLSRKLDGAAVDVQAAITQASRLLPQGMPTPPTFTKVNPADQPVLYIALTSPTLPLWTLDEYAETRIAQRISMISGVAQVQVLGAQKYAVHVQMDPHALASRQIGINEVETALKNWNVNLPTGAIVGPQRAFTLQASGQLMSAAQYRPVVVAYRKGSPVRLEELGKIIDSVEDDKTASLVLHAQGQQPRDAELIQPHGRAIAIGHHHRPILLGTEQLAAGLQGKGALRSDNSAGRQVDVPVLERGLDFVDADLAGRQCVRVHLYVHGVFLRAQHLHLRHAGDHGDALRDARFGVLVQRPKGQRGRGEGDVQNRLVGRIHLGESGRRGHALREQAARPA